MQTEIEAKFLNIDFAKLRSKLKVLNAKLVKSERLMKRKNFDFPDHQLERQVAGWVRVRDEGNKITLTYKQLNDRSLHGTKEVNLTIDSFNSAEEFLKALGLKETSYQETKRESWILDDVEIELDEWPWIPPFVELEAKNEAALKKVAAKLDLDFSKAVHGSVEVAYQAVYDLTEEEVDHMSKITFTATPKWIEERRKI
ncbi:MAG TPA: CYTH domain-containing protein [Candidatus Saccharimonadales bacterium]|nr:CYTH domain-containing protein [Candidatus Saccharimonadales bacterium]